MFNGKNIDNTSLRNKNRKAVDSSNNKKYLSFFCFKKALSISFLKLLSFLSFLVK
jgi:hypothetical protein